MIESLLKKKNSSAQLIPFIMAGHPTLDLSEQIASALIEEGAGAIELGVPFSDALADGPVIQLAAERALQHNVSLEQVLDLASRLAKKHPKTPIVIFSYLNPILQFGVEAYVIRAKKSGVAATLVVDLPPEEADEFIGFHRAHDLKTVFLASPTTTKERLSLIDRSSSGFIYVVSRAGVTGVQNQMSATLGEEISRIRSASGSPLAVGFGISSQAHVREVAKIADCVVVGSAFVRVIEEWRNDPVRLTSEVRNLARELVSGLR